jgi:hypothetical protein
MATVNVLGEVRARYQQQQAVKAAAEARREARLEKWRAEAGQGQGGKGEGPPAQGLPGQLPGPGQPGPVNRRRHPGPGRGRQQHRRVLGGVQRVHRRYHQRSAGVGPSDLGGAATFVNACKQALAEAGF